MLIKSKGITVILPVNASIEDLRSGLRVWPLFCSQYNQGTEIILVRMNDDPQVSEFLNEFLDANAPTGIKMVLTPVPDEELSLVEAYNEGAKYATAPYILFSTASTYPKLDILRVYEKEIDQDVLVLGGIDYIKRPFAYSNVVRDGRDYNPSFRDITHCKEPWSMMADVNFVVPTAMFEQLGGFRTDLSDIECIREFGVKASFKARARYKTAEDAIVLYVHKGDLASKRYELDSDPNKGMEWAVEEYRD